MELQLKTIVGMKTLLVSLCLIASALALLELHPLDDSFINTINSMQGGWTAGRNFNRNTSIKYLRGICGVKQDPTGFKLPLRDARKRPSDFSIPNNYDGRKAHPNCRTIREIRDQGSCGSCWAFGVVEAISDRLCIHSNHSFQFEVSAEDPLSCCTSCGSGCIGGYPDRAWDYWVHNGIVSGGGYHSHKGCYPYQIPPCGVPPHHPVPNYCKQLEKTPHCVEKCEPSYNKTFRRDLHFGVSAYTVDPDAFWIVYEIFQNGPVTAIMTVYMDFFNYKGGVYQHTYGLYAGNHAVKIIGWGVENNQNYWLVANSWGKYWGLQGYFKILRGSNECAIESQVTAGLPREVKLV